MASNAPAPTRQVMTTHVVDEQYIEFPFMVNTGEPCVVRINLKGLRSMYYRAKSSSGQKAVAGPLTVKMQKER